ncbi:NB-ARC domain-containing protein [Dactylosporangium sp. NPDC005572]|uniref:NB-ARC domain-containing protein n=1 Tax=Dactylosporangium sp. NPDC005572 TaxID=3156889 RepID=UPI0033AF0713
MPVPYLTELFLPRPAVEQPALAALLRPAADGGRRIVALTGMSGAGKTLSAQYIAGRPEIEEHFPDGVHWLDARRTPAAGAWQRDLLTRLGVSIPDGADLTDLLRHRLSRLRCLVVLDNLVSTDHDDAFTVTGPDSALLVTTTDRSLLPHRTQRFPLDHFDPAASLALLRRYSGSEAESPAAERVLAHCGGLPLALAICGAMVADGHPWNDVAALLDEADLDLLRQRFAGYPQPTLLAALAAGVRVLDEQERDAYLSLAVFAGQGLVPEAAALRMWSALGLRGNQASTMLLRLAARSLLIRGADGTFTLHELLYRYLEAEAGAGLPALHGRLADRYLAGWGGLAPGLPGVDETDEYGVTRLAYHLERAGRADDLHALLAIETPDGPAFTRNRWFAIHDRNGWTDHYVATLDRARRGAVGRPLELRYALMQASLVSFAGCVPAPLVAALVRVGIWSFAQAWTYAGMITGPRDRTRVLAAVARLTEPGSDERRRFVAGAADAAPEVSDEADRAWVYASLVPLAADAAGMATLALNAAADDTKHALWILARLAGHVPDLVRDRLLAELDREDWLTVDLHPVAVAARHLPELRAPLRARIREVSQADSRLYLEALADPDPDRFDAVLAGRGAGSLRTAAVAVLLAARPTAERVAAVAAVDDAGLAGVALPYLDDSARDALFARCAGRKLDELAPYLPHRLLAAEVDRACALTPGSRQADVLDRLAPHLPPDLVRHALESLVRLDTPEQRAAALVRLAPLLPEARHHHVVAALRAVTRPDVRAGLIVSLVRHVPAALRAELCDLVPPDAEPLRRVMALSSLATHASGARRRDLTRAAAEAHRQVDLGHPELRRLTDGIDTDPLALWSAVLLQLRLDDWRGPSSRGDLAALAAHVPAATVETAVRLAHEIDDGCRRSHAFAALVLCTSGPAAATLLRHAVEAACGPHGHGDHTDCNITAALARAAARVPLPDRLPVAIEPAPDTAIDWNRRGRQDACLAVYTTDRQDEPAPAPRTRPRPALDAAVPRGRPAVLEAVVAAADEETAPHLLDDLLAVERWWPGGPSTDDDGPLFFNAFGEGLAEALHRILRFPEDREQWLSG